MDDGQAIQLAQEGDEAAWVSLVRRYQEEVFRLAWLLLGDADEADDVAQETFIRAFRALDQFDRDRPLRPWLLQITRNLARNRHRSAQRYLAALRRWFEDDSAGATPHVESLTAQQLEAERLRQAVQTLKIRDQEVIYLRYFLDYSVTETALTLDIAEGTVKSRLSRALERLQHTIERDFPDLNRDPLDGAKGASADGEEPAREQS